MDSSYILDLSFIAITLLKGGADTGFRRVLPEVYNPRLLHVKREVVKNAKGREKKIITCSEIPLKRGNLKSDDVFIIDTGKTIYQVTWGTFHAKK